MEDENNSIDKLDIKFNYNHIDPDTPAEKEAAIKEFWRRQRIRNRQEIMWRPIKKLCKWIVIIAIVFSMAYLISFIPTRVSWTTQGVMIDVADINNTGEHMEVTVEGWLYHRWFRYPSFKGQIKLGSFEYTKSASNTSIHFYQNWKGVRQGSPYWYSMDFINIPVDDNTNDSLGMVYTDSRLKTMVFWVFEPTSETGSQSTSRFVVAPGTNTSDARSKVYEFLPEEYHIWFE